MTIPAQLTLPSIDGYQSDSFKTALTGTITHPKDQPARRPKLYDDVVGIFVGTVGESGGKAAYTGGEPTPIHQLKIEVSQILLPLSDDTRKRQYELLKDIYEENRRAAAELGLVDIDDVKEAQEAKAS
jgi:hypothetical protein